MTGTAACWNCRQPLQSAATACLWCGVPQQAPATQFVMAPSGGPGASPSALAPSAPSGPSGLAPSAPSAPGAAGPAPRRLVASPLPERAPKAPRAPRGTALAHPFRGTAAGTGLRLVAFTLDVLVVAGIVTAVALIWESTWLAAIAGIEVAVFLWVLEARTGLTVGNAAVHMRTSRADAPYSPGVGRTLIKNAVTGAGFVVALVGAWVIVGSSAWDASRQGRGWENLASRTRTVAVPARVRETAQVPGVAHAAGTIGQPLPPTTRTAARIAPQVSGLGAAKVVSGIAKGSGSIDDSVAMSQTGISPGGAAMAIEMTAPPVPVVVQQAPAPAPQTVTQATVIDSTAFKSTLNQAESVQPSAAPPAHIAAAPGVILPAPGVVAAPAPAAPAPAAVAPPAPYESPAPTSAAPAPAPLQASPLQATAPAPAQPEPVAPAPTSLAASAPAPAAAPEQAGQGTLLLIFDTGQREQIPLPAIVNLGRKPSAIEPTDHLISVGDPEGTVSKTHVRLEHSRGRTWVTDQGSTNGTELLEDDGDVIKVPAGQRAEVGDGVRVRIGNRTFTISVLVTGAPQGVQA